MLEISKLLKNNNLKTRSYSKQGNIILVDTNEGKKIIKKTNNTNIYKYLNSRNFNYFPNIKIEDNYQILDYVIDIEYPKEQKIEDMIKLVALLHNKTTFYKEISQDEIKKTYEKLLKKIEEKYNYYLNYITIIETKEFMSPSEYLLARNISKIFNCLNFSKYELDNWYDLVKDKKKERYVIIHNNLELNHFIKNEESYFISWEKSKIDIPIYDFYKLYKKHSLEYNFIDLLNLYEKEYPLLEEERKLLFILISIPNKIENNLKEYEKTKQVGKIIEYLYKTDDLISPYYSNNTIPNK